MDFESSGRLQTRNGFDWYVEVDEGLADYYRKQIPFRTQKQRYKPHISIVRNEIYKPIKLYSELEFKFKYSHYICWNDTYVWLAAECLEAEIFRRCIGLQPYSLITQAPSLESKFHITLGNMKEAK